MPRGQLSRHRRGHRTVWRPDQGGDRGWPRTTLSARGLCRAGWTPWRPSAESWRPARRRRLAAGTGVRSQPDPRTWWLRLTPP